MNSIQIQGISKKFGSVVALDGINLTLEQGKIYGLLGRNGAGKTTLLKVITNRIFADQGSVTIDGQDHRQEHAQADIYLMSEADMYPEDCRLKKLFGLMPDFYPDFDREYALRLAEEFHLPLKKKIKALSTGYISIYKLILALSVNTPYVLFDEPILGLDANHRELFYRRLIERYSEKPCTIVISTHLIEEVSGIVEDVIIIHDGRIIRNESRESLLACGYTVAGKAADVDAFIQGREVLGVEGLGGLKTAYLLGKPQDTGVPYTLEVSRMDLQKLFVKLTGDEEVRRES